MSGAAAIIAAQNRYMRRFARQTGGEGQWQSNPLISEASAALRPAVPPEQDLDRLPEHAVHEGRVLAGVHLVQVADLAGVEDVAQQPAQVVAGEGPAAARLPGATEKDWRLRSAKRR